MIVFHFTGQADSQLAIDALGAGVEKQLRQLALNAGASRPTIDWQGAGPDDALDRLLFRWSVGLLEPPLTGVWVYDNTAAHPRDRLVRL